MEWWWLHHGNVPECAIIEDPWGTIILFREGDNDGFGEEVDEESEMDTAKYLCMCKGWILDSGIPTLVKDTVKEM